MIPTIQIGSLAIQTPGLSLLLGAWLGLTFAERHSRQFGINPANLYTVTMAGLIFGLLGARLAYVARYPEAFISSPVSLLSINPGLLDPLAGLATGALAAYLYAHNKKLPVPALLDALTPALAIFGIALGISHLASGAHFGTPTDLPWAIDLWGELRHPLQVYEIPIASLWKIGKLRGAVTKTKTQT